MRKVMTRVFPLPAPARMSTGPSVVSTASRCCGFSWSRKDNAESGSGVDLSILHGCAQLTCRFKAAEWWLTTLKPGWRSNAKRPIGHSPLKTFSRNFLRKPFAAQRSFHGVDKGGAPGRVTPVTRTCLALQEAAAHAKSRSLARRSSYESEEFDRRASSAFRCRICDGE